MKKYYDVSRPIENGMMIYPGDKKVVFRQTCSIDKEGYSWRELNAGTHISTHIDAPTHFCKNGKTLDDFDVSLMISTVEVIEINADMITSEVLEKIKIGDWKTVFFKTKNQKLWKRKKFSSKFVSLTTDAAEFLVKKQTKLVGIDYMSIEEHATHAYPVHKILLGRGIFIIEGLILNKVPAGKYNLYCFPLKLSGADGGPSRIILESQEATNGKEY